MSEMDISFKYSLIPMHLPCKSVANPLQVPFLAYSMERTCNGFATDLERRRSGLKSLRLRNCNMEIAIKIRKIEFSYYSATRHP